MNQARRHILKLLGRFPWLIRFIAPVVKFGKKRLRSVNMPGLEVQESRELRARQESRLLALDVETSNICNANCGFCGYRFRALPPKIMATADFAKILDRFVEYGGGSLSFTPLVGEALLDSDLLTKIRMARSYAQIGEISLATNLIAMNRHNVLDLLSSGVNWVYVSTCIGDTGMYRRVYVWGFNLNGRKG